MKKKFIISILLMMTFIQSTYVDASDSREQVFVMSDSYKIDILHLSNLEGNGVNVLLGLKDRACYLGNQYLVIDRLNDIFNLIEHSSIIDKWEINFTQATSANLMEQKAGFADSIGVEYELMSGNHPRSRFLIHRCK